jgi:signal transduction histidine kinase
MGDHHDSCADVLSLAVHEFRTPVSVVAGYLRILLRYFGDSLTDQQRKIVEDSERSCGKVSALLAELSDLAKLEAHEVALRRERVALLGLVRDLGAAGPEGADCPVILDVDETDPAEVLGDRGRLREVLRTLLAATARERVGPSPLVVTCRTVGQGAQRVARVAVGDPETVESAMVDRGDPTHGFDEFRGGLGFRLVIASRVVAAHGGTLSSPVAARGRLSLVVSLPAALPPEGSA